MPAHKTYTAKNADDDGGGVLIKLCVLRPLGKPVRMRINIYIICTYEYKHVLGIPMYKLT